MKSEGGGGAHWPLSYLRKVVIRIYSFKVHFFYSLLRVTHHTVLRNSAFEKGKDRALDLLPQKTVARLEVLRPVPCKFLETRLVKPVVI